MKAFIAFTKKEFTEYLRTYKILILGTVFLLFGMMNPVLAKFTPEIIKAAGLDLNLPDPTALDSWAQFFKNVAQMGLVIVLILYSGIMANEFSKGTLINILTKGLKRRTVILAKFTVASMLWTLSYFLCFIVTYSYTAYFWPITGLHNELLTFSSLWLYGEFLISLVILGGVLFKNNYGSLLLAGGLTLVMTLINIFPKLQQYNPITLSSDNMSMLTALKPVSHYYPAMVICGVLTCVFMVSSVILFNKKQI